MHVAKHLTGNYSVKEAENIALRISKEIRSKVDFWIQIFKKQEAGGDSKQQYVLALNIRLPKDKNDSYRRVKKFVSLLQQRLNKKHNIKLRHLAALCYR